jgi:hypothetical protein
MGVEGARIEYAVSGAIGQKSHVVGNDQYARGRRGARLHFVELQRVG